MSEKPTKFASSLGIRYPTLRDNSLKTPFRWLRGKRADDGAEGLWRVHDGLYELGEFVRAHPGGPAWLDLTRGTDITEAFETHHLSARAEETLARFFVRKATLPRNSPFTFDDGGFYRTLKRNIAEKMAEVPKGAVDRSKRITDSLVAAYVGLAVLAIFWKSFFLGTLAGVVLSTVAIASHNFLHQKDNFRMYYHNLSLLDYTEFRVSHALSHHLHTNTINDLEISALEPFFEYLPGRKQRLATFVQILISPVVYLFIFLGTFARRIVSIILKETTPGPIVFLPFSILGLMVLVSRDIRASALMFGWIQLIGSLHFGIVGLNAGHHHPDVFHDGDAARPRHELDWGIHQLDAVMDRKDIVGSHFLVLTNFGDHALHHLFPTVDHGLLEHLYPTFLKTCFDFGIEWRLSSQTETTKGQIRQLAKIEPNAEPPRPLRSPELLRLGSRQMKAQLVR